MEELERKKWEEIRAKGKGSYVFKNSLVGIILIFLIYFGGNAYVNRETLDEYIQYNLVDNVEYTTFVLIFTFVVFLIINYIIWIINEKRYLKSDINSEEEDNNA